MESNTERETGSKQLQYGEGKTEKVSFYEKQKDGERKREIKKNEKENKEERKERSNKRIFCERTKREREREVD